MTEDWLGDEELLCTKVAAINDELNRIWREHLDDNFGTALTHQYFGEVADWFASAKAGSDAGRKQLCELLETALESGSAEVMNLIQVSFVENLPGEPQPWYAHCFGPALTDDMRRVFGGPTYGGKPPQS